LVACLFVETERNDSQHQRFVCASAGSPARVQTQHQEGTSLCVSVSLCPSLSLCLSLSLSLSLCLSVSLCLSLFIACLCLRVPYYRFARASTNATSRRCLSLCFGLSVSLSLCPSLSLSLPVSLCSLRVTVSASLLPVRPRECKRNIKKLETACFSLSLSLSLCFSLCLVFAASSSLPYPCEQTHIFTHTFTHAHTHAHTHTHTHTHAHAHTQEFAKMITVLQGYCLVCTDTKICCTNQIGKG
jgi:hypothetical protein